MKYVKPTKQDEVKRVIWKEDGYSFPKMLKKVRLEKGLSRTQLGLIIGKRDYQVQRYEMLNKENQVPPLHVFALMCVALQIDPKELLGLKWVEAKNNPEPGMIYDRAIDAYDDLINKEFRKFRWRCPHCGVTNYEYDAYSSKLGKMVRTEFMCENCAKLYDKFYEWRKK